MNTVLNSYGQLCGCPEILKKVVNFFVVGLTYGCRKLWTVRCGSPFRLHSFVKALLNDAEAWGNPFSVQER